MKNNIKEVIQTIDDLFKNYNRDNRRFTVDYDETTDGLFCNYTPYVNDSGYAVTDDLLMVYDTSKKNLLKLKEYLEQNKIQSRPGWDWDVSWGIGE